MLEDGATDPCVARTAEAVAKAPKSFSLIILSSLREQLESIEWRSREKASSRLPAWNLFECRPWLFHNAACVRALQANECRDCQVRVRKLPKSGGKKKKLNYQHRRRRRRRLLIAECMEKTQFPRFKTFAKAYRRRLQTLGAI